MTVRSHRYSSFVALFAAAVLICASGSDASAQGTAAPPPAPAEPSAQTALPDKASDQKKDDKKDQKKDNQAERPKQHGADRVRVRMAGHEQQVNGSGTDLSAGGFHPLVGLIIPGSGLSAGLDYRRLRLRGSPIGFDVAGEVSYLGFQSYRLQVGSIERRDTTETLQPVDADVASLFNDHSVKSRGLAAYADVRYIHYPAKVYYGVGPNALGRPRADYVWFGALFDGVVQYQFRPTFGVSGRVGLLAPGLGTGSDEASQARVDVAKALGVPHFLTTGGAAVLDARDEPADPHRGAFLGTAVWRFNGLGGSTYDFLRVTLDGRWYRALFSPRGILATRALASVERPSHGAVVPFYLEQTLGGPDTLRGYAYYRFRDRALVTFSAEYRFLVNGYLDIGPFVDGGTVAHSFTKLDLGDLELSGGIRAGLRYKGRVLFNVGWGYCHEGNRFFIGAGTLF